MLCVELVKLPCFYGIDVCIVGGRGLALWKTIAVGWLASEDSSLYEEGASSLYCRKSYASVTGTLSKRPSESGEPWEFNGCCIFNLKLLSKELEPPPIVCSLLVLPVCLGSPSAEFIVRFGSALLIMFSPLSVTTSDEEKCFYWVSYSASFVVFDMRLVSRRLTLCRKMSIWTSQIKVNSVRMSWTKSNVEYHVPC